MILAALVILLTFAIYVLCKVLLNNLENLSAAEKDVASCRKELRAARVNDIVRRGLAELKYEPKALTSLNVAMKWVKIQVYVVLWK